ncbi:SDR family oxidoreductase [Rhodococcus rhodnii]|uniref:Dehydrogenase n=2 Tax=Rhodococcus rhodnii TaxID=38312 RepID=R7WMK3_9NOCA|nr:SDR family oxidoreductase [Rhodococcus rhodnii]EOM76537.1 dehydrogenase [Rhodococcus rhodnii LMG 5362]TXG92153.1 SDR family oxidoreductase [Rhodococcus rhodnii]
MATTQPHSRPVAVVTGPTSGIGAGFARRLASLGYDLVLVARDTQRLTELADDLHARYTARCDTITADLATAEGRDAVAQRLHSGVDVLVNNAGFGTSGEFWTLDPATLRAQVDVNVTAVVELTRAALPAMVASGGGAVVNVASVAGLIPGRGSTYPASKAYVVAFTRGLVDDLDGTGVDVLAVCPGLVRTEFHDRAGMAAPRVPEFLWRDVDDVVDTALEDLRKGRTTSIAGLPYKAVVVLARILPVGLAHRVARFVVRRSTGTRRGTTPE